MRRTPSNAVMAGLVPAIHAAPRRNPVQESAYASLTAPSDLARTTR